MSARAASVAVGPLPVSQARSPLAQLLHALNQPLTGLQCSMEVALAAPRTVEQYRQGLRDGLDLTARMRLLVDAVREVVNGQERAVAELEVFDLMILLRDTMTDLAPVAEQKRIRSTVCVAGAALVQAERQRWAGLLFQSLEAVISLAAADSELAIAIQKDLAAQRVGMSLRVHWYGDGHGRSFSRAQVGLLVAEAGWAAVGAEWRREQIDAGETVTIQLAQTTASGGESRVANG